MLDVSGTFKALCGVFFTMEQFCLSNARGCTCMQVRQYTVLPMFTRYSTDLQVVATHQEMAAMCQQRPGRSYKLLVYKDVNNAGFKKYWKNRLCKCFTWKEIHWTRRIHNAFWWETFTVNNFLFLLRENSTGRLFKGKMGKKN